MSNQKREIAIKISNVKKRYKLVQIGGGTFKEDVQSWWAKVRGKEDPNAKIDEDTRSNGKVFMALNGIDLTIYKGEAVGIIGMNGAGKSTLLKLLCRVTAPTEGEIDLYGRITSMLEVGTGFNGELTGRENIYMNGAILGMTKAEIDAKMDDIIEFSEVSEFIDTPVKRYSSGMFIKLGFSVAAHLDSEIMIMDEVLAVGDMAFQTKCLTKMREVAKTNGRTVLYVSHNMNTIRKLCDRCIVLDKGKVIFDGDVEEAIQIYLSEKRIMRIVNECNKERERKDINGLVHVDRITFLDKENSPIYYQNENIKILVECTSKIAVNDASMRWTLHSKSGTHIGMATTKSCLSLQEGKNSVVLRIELDWLAPGDYFVDFSVCRINDYGSFELYDVVNGAFSFRKSLTENNNNGMEWNHDWWGYVMFPEIQILNGGKN